MGSSL
jgi:hypothetical protein